MKFDRIQQTAIILQTMPELTDKNIFSEKEFIILNDNIKALQDEYNSYAINVFDKDEFKEIMFTLNLADKRLTRMNDSLESHYNGLLNSHQHYLFTNRQAYLEKEEKSRKSWFEFSKTYGYNLEYATGMKYLFGRVIDLKNFSRQIDHPFHFVSDHKNKQIVYTDNANNYLISLRPEAMYLNTKNTNPIQYTNTITTLESAFIK